MRTVNGLRRSPTERIPVEIWIKILLAVIDVPYVLDTTVPVDGCYWHQQNLYHTKIPYEASEVVREGLRDVCLSWRRFADEHKHRWITYDTRLLPDPSTTTTMDSLGHPAPKDREQETKEAEEAILSTPCSKPQRMLIYVVSERSWQFLRKCIGPASAKLTTLFISGSDRYGTLIFQYLIENSEALPCLRCLMLTTVDFTGTPLSLISKAFPKLTGLTLERGITPHNSEDYLNLPQLESLYLDFHSLEGMRPETWNMPELARLSSPISAGQLDIILALLKTHGTSLIFLHFYYLDSVTLPQCLWKYCPNLREIATSFSQITFEGPMPSSHPLEYAIHCTNYTEYDLDANTWRLDPPEAQKKVLLKNIDLFPPSFKTFTVAFMDWNRYLQPQYRIWSVQAASGNIRARTQTFWERISDMCYDKGFTFEDKNRETLANVLAREKSRT